MAVTQADLDALNRAIASGVRSVTFGDQTTTYNTTASLIAARDDVAAQLKHQEAASTGAVVPRRAVIQFAGRGYE